MELSLFLNKLFKDFHEQQIPYAVLRNYETLPKHNLSNDIDILINKKYIHNVLKILSWIEDIYIVDVCKRTYVTNVYLFNIEDQEKVSLQLDFVYDFNWKGLTYLNVDEVLNDTDNYNGFHVVSKYYESVILFWSKLILQGQIKEKYTYIFQIINENQERFLRDFGGVLGNSHLKNILSEQNIGGAQPAYLKKKFIFWALKTSPVKAFLRNCKHNIQETYLRYSTVLKYLIIVPRELDLNEIKSKLSNTTSNFSVLNSGNKIINVLRFLFKPVASSTLFIVQNNKRLPFVKKQFSLENSSLMDYINARQKQLKPNY